jgi:FkbM family methyltransferase
VDRIGNLVTNYQYQLFGGQSYAQHGEDLIVLNILFWLGIDPIRYIDIGANDPHALSNTALMYERGHRGVLVEANPHVLYRFKAARPDDKLINAAVVGYDGLDHVTLHRVSHDSGLNSTIEANIKGHGRLDNIRVPATTLPKIVANHCDGKWPDFLSIDAEGRDLEILQSVPPYACSVICVEALTGPSDISDDIRVWSKANGFYVHTLAGGNMILVNIAHKDRLH